MKELIVATTNQGKVKEIQAMLKDLNIEVKSLKDVYDDVPDIVEDGKTGFLFEMRNSKDMADKLRKFVFEEGLSAQLGKQARTLCEERYNTVKHMEEVVKILKG